MKLKIELVPSSCWYSNLRSVLSREAWDKIRYRAYWATGHRCKVCCRKLMLSCHEVWRYDDVKLVQTLIGFEALCMMCHMVKHIGYAGILAEDGKLDYRELIRHFMRVNECSYEDFEEHKAEAFEVWVSRSLEVWRCELGEYGVLVLER